MRKLIKFFNRPIAFVLVLAMVISLFSSYTVHSFAEGEGGTAAESVTTETTEESIVEDVLDVQAIYDALMACQTLEEGNTVLSEYTEEEENLFYNSLTDEQKENLSQKIIELENKENVDGEMTEETPVTEPVPEQLDTSSIINAVNYTNAGPFLEPIEGEIARRFSLRSVAPTDPVGKDNSGIITSKTVTPNADGTEYTIRLESYVTGSTTTDTVSEEIPTDIILVLDQSGSMEDPMGKLAYTDVEGTAQNLYNNYRDTLYAKVGDNYNKITVTRDDGTTTTTYSAISSNRTENGEIYNRYFNNLYYKVGDKYYKVTIILENHGTRNNPSYSYVYTYVDDNGVTQTIYTSDNDASNDDVPQNIRNNFYTSSSTTVYKYTFTYEGADGTAVTETYNATDNIDKYYRQYTDSSQSRLEALEKAVQSFTNAVAIKAAGEDGDITTTDDNVNHRVAIVGFGMKGSYSGWTDNHNSEVFIGANQYNYSVVTTDNNTVYGQALQSMDTQAGVTNVRATVGYDANGDGDYNDTGDVKGVLDAEGGTYVDLGMEMANGIFSANPIATGTKRNRVVIVFTDGIPGTNSSWGSDSTTVANSAISQAYTTKNTHKATVYTVGVFDGANAKITVSSDKKSVTMLGTDNPNKYMHYLSSNFKTAQSMSDTTYTQTFPQDKDGNFTGDSYYLSAGDADALNNIFEKISDMIQSGSSSVDLGSTTVVKDVVSSYFKLPDGADTSDITISTYSYNPSGATDADKWVKDAAAYGNPTATIIGKTVNVTGFDFAANYVDGSKGRLDAENPDKTGTFYGRKLVIEFKVVPEEGFLGGNGVPTNGTESGIYKDGTVMENFEYPRTNVPIQDISLSVQDKNVYLLGNLTVDQMLSGATATSNGTDLFGLTDTSWEDDYVTVSTTDPSDLASLENDTQYSVTVSIAPLYDADASYSGTAATEKTATAKGNVNVFKPVLTFQDSSVYYGAAEPIYETTNRVGNTVWAHGDTVATDVTMIGDAPSLTLTYAPDTGAVDNGLVVTTKDYHVNVTVKIGDVDIPVNHRTFVHETCTTENCGFDETKGKFMIHILSLPLTINKAFAGSTKPQVGETFIFTVKGTTGTATADVDITVTLVAQADGSVAPITINNLPIGDYTVTEDMAWSWRYQVVDLVDDEYVVVDSDKAVDLSQTQSVTFTNQIKNNKWIDSNAYCENTFLKVGSSGNVSSNKVNK